MNEKSYINVFSMTGLGNTAKYLVIGNGISLFRYTTPFNRLRTILESIYLHSAFLFRRYEYVEIETLNSSLQQLTDIFGEDSKGFFIDTSWYKQTYYVGALICNGEMLFIKSFKKKIDADEEANKAEIFKTLSNGIFRTATLRHKHNNIVAYELLNHKGKRASANELLGLIVKLCEKANRDSYLAILSEKIELDLLMHDELEKVLGVHFSKFCKAVQLFLNDVGLLPFSLCHGDFTVWNTLKDVNNKICLIDYERVSERVAFTDIFHMVIQPKCLNCESSVPDDIVSIVDNILLNSENTAIELMSAYLLEELSIDIRDIVDGIENQLLNRIVKSKSIMFINAIDRMNSTTG